MAERRRLPQDSVVASLGQIQDMLREEALDDRSRTVVQQRSAPPTAKAVAFVEAVPSQAEVAASRNARWAEEPGPRLVPVRTRLRFRRTRRIAVVVAVLAAGAVAGVVGARGLAGADIGRAHSGAMSRAVNALSGALDQERTNMTAVKAQVAKLKAQVIVAQSEARRAQEAQTIAEAALATQAAAEISKEARKTPTVRKAKVRTRRTRKPRKRRTRRPTRTDRAIDNLLDGI